MAQDTLTQASEATEQIASTETIEHIVETLTASTGEAFQMMFSAGTTRLEVAPLTPETKFHAVSGIIGLSGWPVSGCVCLSLPGHTAFQCVERMLGMPVDELDGLVCDAVGEFVNVIAGRAKSELFSKELNLGLPSVVQGESYRFDFPTGSQPTCISFDSDLGPFLVVFAFAGSYEKSSEGE